MTVYDIYDRSIQDLPASARLKLAQLILNDLSPLDAVDMPGADSPGAVRDRAHLEELLLDGLNSGPGIEVAPDYWRAKRDALLDSKQKR